LFNCRFPTALFKIVVTKSPWNLDYTPEEVERRITIQALTQDVGEIYGEPTETYADWKTVWANVYSGSGREL